MQHSCVAQAQNKGMHATIDKQGGMGKGLTYFSVSLATLPSLVVLAMPSTCPSPRSLDVEDSHQCGWPGQATCTSISKF
eukprot:322649-Pelagomonas_calceolata.AAC.1